MSQNHIEYHEHIEQFLKGELSPKETAAIRAKMETTPSFQKLVHQHQLVLEAMDEAAKQAFLSRLDAGKTKPDDSAWKKWLIGFMILLTVFFSYMILDKFIFSAPEPPPSPEQHYKGPIAFADPGEINLAPRNNEAAALILEKAVKDYRQSNFQGAATHFDEYLKVVPSDYEAIFYKGKSLRLSENLEKANKVFLELIATQDNHLYGDGAKWELALSYLREGNKEEANVLLQELANDDASDYYEKAKPLLENR